MPVNENITLVAIWKEVVVEEVDVPPAVPNAPIITLGQASTVMNTALQTPPTFSSTAIAPESYFIISKEVSESTTLQMNTRAYDAFRIMAQQFNRDTRGNVMMDTGDRLALNSATADATVALRVEVLRSDGNGKFHYEESRISSTSSQLRVQNAAEWLSYHAATYGFVNTTGQNYRYVGAGIALALQARNSDSDSTVKLDAYLAEVKAAYTEDGTHLTVTTNGGDVYEIWYAAKDASGKIKIPTGKTVDCVSYDGGYVISVKMH